ncbi:hypothetical protein DXG03_008748, partial [Asterophora parasitica]
MQLSCTPTLSIPQYGHGPFIPLRKSTGLTAQLEEVIKAAQEVRDICGTKGSFSREEEEAMSKDWEAVHADQTRAWSDDIFARFREAAAKAKSTSLPPAKEKKPVFNHEYTPLLEKYFEYNAYPSAADRAVLARKSMMTPRQIEVWFQNHRNRARKDGKHLRKLTEDPLPLEISLKSLERKMPFFTIPEHERRPVNKPEPPKTDFSDDENDPLPPTRVWDPCAPDVLDPPGPSHAYPAIYPPGCDYDPFPSKVDIPAPVWYRTLSAPRRPSKTLVDIDEFIADFETKLHLRVPVLRSKASQSWCSGRVTLPSPAPHPAFVRCPFSARLSTASHLPVAPAPPSRLHPFRSPSPFSHPTTLIPPEHLHTTPTRRKAARLPKRTPKNTSIAHRRGSPAVSEASPSPSRSSSYASISSSFGSEISSDRRPSSSSSSSSSPSALTTPLAPHSELPEDARSPVSISGVDFETSDDLFGSNMGTLSPVDGTPFNYAMPPQLKQSYSFGFDIPTSGRRSSPG